MAEIRELVGKVVEASWDNLAHRFTVKIEVGEGTVVGYIACARDGLRMTTIEDHIRDNPDDLFWMKGQYEPGQDAMWPVTDHGFTLKAEPPPSDELDDLAKKLLDL